MDSNKPDFPNATILAHYGIAGLSSGDIPLSEPFTNFEYIWVIGSDDNSKYICNNLWYSQMINDQLSFLGFNILSGGANYWNILPYFEGTTSTLWKVYSENSRIRTIYGVNRINQ